MSVLTIRLTETAMSKKDHERLKQLAKSRNISLNKLMDELSTIALAEFDTYNRYLARAESGNPKEALKILDRLDGR